MSDTLFQKTYDSIKDNRKKGAIWIPLPYPKLSSYVGITQRQYILLGGDPGTGKTAFAYRSFILGPYDYILNNPDTRIKFKATIWAFERSKERTMAKLICLVLWRKRQILVDVPTVLSWGEGTSKVDDALLHEIEQCRDYLEGLESMVDIRDAPLNPTGMWKVMEQYALSNGTIRETVKSDGYVQKEYVPNNPDELVFWMTDHTGLARKERGFDDKQNLDKLSEYKRQARDRFGHSSCSVTQFNRGTNDMSRRKAGFDLLPEKSDFKGSGNMYEDADLVMAGFNPAKYGIKQHLGYEVGLFRSGPHNRFRSQHVLKNTYGPDDLHIGCQFVGECGDYNELPRASEMTPPDYRAYADLSDRIPEGEYDETLISTVPSFASLTGVDLQDEMGE